MPVELGKRGPGARMSGLYPGPSLHGSDACRGSSRDHPTVKPTAMLEDFVAGSHRPRRYCPRPLPWIRLNAHRRRADRPRRLPRCRFDLLLCRCLRAPVRAAMGQPRPSSQTGETFSALAARREPPRWSLPKETWDRETLFLYSSSCIYRIGWKTTGSRAFCNSPAAAAGSRKAGGCGPALTVCAASLMIAATRVLAATHRRRAAERFFLGGDLSARQPQHDVQCTQNIRDQVALICVAQN